MFAVTPAGMSSIVLSAEPLGRGGEGEVFGIVAHGAQDLPPASSLVAKLYHGPASQDRLAKLKAMIVRPPTTDQAAWPLGLVVDDEKRFKGFLMPRVDTRTYRPWSDLAHVKERRKTPNFDVRYGLMSARNFIAAVSSIHDAGHVVGDINESNTYVGSDASVLLVDLDSAQIVSTGLTYPCEVGKPEYTAPELQGQSFKDSVRTPESDTFALGVALYQMMTGGAHPTDGTWSSDDPMPSVGQKIAAGALPGFGRPAIPGLGHPARIPTQAIPREVQTLILAMLSPAPDHRPPLARVVLELDRIVGTLVQCSRVLTHWHASAESCGWCDHAAAGRPDPWANEASPSAAQRRLPPLDFTVEDEEVQIRRAAPARAGSPAAAPPASMGPSASPHGPTQSNVPSPTPASPTVPTKHKGKTVLQYPDGTYRVRPPLLDLFRSQPRLALSCLADETPDLARFWWPASRALAQPLALKIGVGVSLVFAFAWLLIVPKLFEAWAPTWASVGPLVAVLAAMGTVLSSTSLWAFGMFDRRRARKAAGTLSRFQPEPTGRTVARFAALSLVYGPLLVIGLVLFAFYLGFSLLVEALRPAASAPPPRRY